MTLTLTLTLTLTPTLILTLTPTLTTDPNPNPEPEPTPEPEPDPNPNPSQVDAIQAIIMGGAALPQSGTPASLAVLQAVAGACHLGKNQAVRTACAGLPGIISDYCMTLPSDRQALCMGAQQALVAQLGHQPVEGMKIEPRVLAAVVLLLLVFFSVLANRKKHLSQLPGLCMRLPLAYALFSRKKWSRGSTDELDDKDGN